MQDIRAKPAEPERGPPPCGSDAAPATGAVSLGFRSRSALDPNFGRHFSRSLTACHAHLGANKCSHMCSHESRGVTM